MSVSDAPGVGSGNLESMITGTGSALLDGISGVIAAMPTPPNGPVQLAREVGVDKVLASRVMKALRSADPVTVVFRMPGPDPLRRLVRGAAKQGIAEDRITGALGAIDRFEHLIKVEVGDRGSLDTILSAWVPEARREFELRRKQAAFKAMSQLKGAQARSILSTVLLHPSADGERLDIVWVSGLIGLHRLRPGAPVKFATRRVSPEPDARHPFSLGGSRADDLSSVQLESFCTTPMPELLVERAGEVTHYVLAPGDFGPRSAVDIVCAEVNESEMRRVVPRGSGRKAYVFAETSIPCEILQFDAFVHEDVYPGRSPALRLYDTAFDGVADINDPSRDIDRLDMLESIDELGRGLTSCRSQDIPRYHELLSHVFEQLGWSADAFRGYRSRIDYPVYGSQIAMMFDPPEA